MSALVTDPGAPSPGSGHRPRSRPSVFAPSAPSAPPWRWPSPTPNGPTRPGPVGRGPRRSRPGLQPVPPRLGAEPARADRRRSAGGGQPAAVRGSGGGLRGGRPDRRHRRPDHRLGSRRARLRPGLRPDRPGTVTTGARPVRHPAGGRSSSDPGCPHRRRSARRPRRPRGHGQGFCRRPGGPADRRVLGVGALVNLGGDVAVAGACPAGGWAVGIAPRCTDPTDRSVRWWPSPPVAWPHRGRRPARGSGTDARCTTSSTRGPGRRPARSGPTCRSWRRAAWRPMPGARPRWCGATMLSATSPASASPLAWSTPTEPSSASAGGRSRTGGHRGRDPATGRLAAGPVR